MTITPAADLQARYLPSHEAMAAAAAVLKADPAAELALIPMWLPGKQRGIWQLGQEVRTVAAVLPTAQDTYRHGRNLAEILARAELGDKPGVTACAIVDLAGHCSVMEDI